MGIDQSAELQKIIESARRLGVEMDEAESLRWLTAIAAESGASELQMDVASGTYGYRPSMLDFSPKDIARFRRIGEIVEVTGEGAESALALSGSAAQSKIQTFPGDADFFQRLNIKTDTREEACAVAARLLRAHALANAGGPTYQFIEAKFGTHAVDGLCARRR